MRAAVLALVALLLVSIASGLSIAQRGVGGPQARAWLVVIDYGNGTVRPVLYLAGLAPPGALEVSGRLEATNESANLTLSASLPLLATILEQRGVESLAVTLTLSKNPSLAQAIASGRVDAVIHNGNLSINNVKAVLEPVGTGLARLTIYLGGIRGNVTSGDVADYLTATLSSLLAGSKPNVTVAGDYVNMTATIRGNPVVALLDESIGLRGTLIILSSGGNASITMNATLTGNVTGLFRRLAPQGEGFKPVMPARATIETLDNGTLRVLMPLLALKSASPEDVAETLSLQLGEALGGEVGYSIVSSNAGKASTPPGSPPARAPGNTTLPQGAEGASGGQGGAGMRDTWAYAVSGIIVLGVVIILIRKLRG